MNTELQKLKNEIHSCNKCSRLVDFRNNVLNDSKRYSGEVFWRKPVSGYGDIDGRILIIGLIVTGPQIMAGFFNNPTDSARVLKEG